MDGIRSRSGSRVVRRRSYEDDKKVSLVKSKSMNQIPKLDLSQTTATDSQLRTGSGGSRGSRTIRSSRRSVRDRSQTQDLKSEITNGANVMRQQDKIERPVVIQTTKDWLVKYGQVIELEPIGSGRSGSVRRALLDDLSVAVKKVDTRFLSPECLESLDNELAILGLVNCPQIVKSLGYRKSLHDGQVSLFFTLYQGTLRELIEARKSQGEQQGEVRLSGSGRVYFFEPGRIRSFLIDVAKALEFCHSFRQVEGQDIYGPIIHRDVKSDNCFYQVISGQEYPPIKLADFGEAIFYNRARTRRDNLIGTLEFMSPEMVKKGKDYNCLTDIWSYGMLIFELLTLDLPYRAEIEADWACCSPRTNNQMLQMIAQGQRPNLDNYRISQKLFKEYLDLYLSCTQLKPELRPGAKDIIQLLLKFD